LVFAKYRAARAAAPLAAARIDDAALQPRRLERLLEPAADLNRGNFFVRSLVLGLTVLWGVRIASFDIRDGEMMSSFMHAILLPMHEAGHVLFAPFGQFLHIAGGSLLQLLVPLGIGLAFIWKHSNNFGACLCLWWLGTSLIDLAPYIYDAHDPQLILLSGRTGNDGAHDWIDLLGDLGLLQSARGVGRLAQLGGIAVMSTAWIWGIIYLQRSWRRLRDRRHAASEPM
jgi:hypothetical protein